MKRSTTAFYQQRRQHGLNYNTYDLDRYTIYSARLYENRPNVHYIVNKIIIKMLYYKSESLANGEKQSERSWCIEMVADCSKRPHHRLWTYVFTVQCVYVEWRTAAQVDAVGLTRRRRRGRRRSTDTVKLWFGPWRLRVWTWCGTSPATSEAHGVLE